MLKFTPAVGNGRFIVMLSSSFAILSGPQVSGGQVSGRPNNLLSLDRGQVLVGVDRPPLNERETPFLCLICLNIVRSVPRSRAGDFLHVLSVLVERDLLQLENDRAVVLDNIAVSQHLGLELIVGNDRVYQPHVRRLLACVPLG